jgi:threonine-phosphate decarboxylase
MVAAPTFSDYERSAQSYGSEIHRFALTKRFETDGGFIQAVRRAEPDLVFVCNPNNPTGILTGSNLVEDLLDCCRRIGAWVAVDECFMDFTINADENTSKVFLKRYPNLVIMKAFTKTFALPGVRLGYAICDDMDMVDRLYAHGAEWPVSNLAQAAGIAALSGADEYIKKTRAYVEAERMTLQNGLARLGYDVFESAANYVFIKSPYPFDLCCKLDKKGIRIRSCKNYHGLDGSYYRVAVSTKENNAAFINAISVITKSGADEKVR